MILWVIILFAAGMSLILAEFIVPGMVCGVLGTTLVIASVVLGCYTYPEYSAMIVIGELLGVFVSVVLGMYMMARTRAARRLVLGTSQQQDAGWVASESDMSLMGAEGMAYTKLRPAGTIVVNGKRIDAVSNGGFIDKGARIHVLEVHGSRVVVEPVGEE